MTNCDFLPSPGNGIDLLLLSVVQLRLYKKKNEDCKKAELVLFVVYSPPGL